MTRISRSVVGVMLGLALTLLLPSAVQGEEGRLPPITGFRLKASNGYVLFALAGVPKEEEEEEEEEEIGLFLVHGKRAMVTYAAPATVTRTTIDADLGKLGRISVTRVPTGRMKTVRRNCKPGSRKRVKAERYEGTIEFHGEEGFTEVSATSAPLEPTFLCIGSEWSGRPPGKSLPGARLDVDKRRLEKYRLEFDATQRRPGARTGVSVEVEEHRGEMEIHRAIWTWAGAGALRYDRRLRTATVRPPAPFAGHGSFHRNARHGNQWTGNLTVDLPGRADVPVTGRGFSAGLEHPRR
ncbi:MAG: hypothetical protein ACM3N0_01220 [Chloroflexota bacterium]